ncbi:MAG: aromatic ring-hydroxylating dioxygenase subunit alpha [Rhodospirillales bacterium]|nr:aromatic ring-hydroxylating dioxygenase subunit alpha [Rhodospirillales bacterium]
MSGIALFPAARGFDPAVLSSVDAEYGSARPLPAEAYVSPSWYDEERARLWTRNWVCLTAASYIPNPGDVIPLDLAAVPLFAIRGRDGEVRVFHNACPHRGARLVSEKGNAGVLITCPYHNWAFGFGGELRQTPHIAGTGRHACEGFSKDAFGIKPVRSAVWFDQVFVNLSGDAEPFEDYIAPLAQRWAAFDGNLIRHGGEDSIMLFDLKANWKLAVENFCEAYHLPMVHPGLNSYSKLEDHENIEEPTYSGQVSLVYNPDRGDHVLPRFPDLPEHWKTRAEYVALYPNVLLGIHYDHFKAIRILPDGPDRCHETFDIYYVGDEPTQPGNANLRATVRETWREVFQEDVDVVQGMQMGRASPGFDGGVFTPVLEGPSWCFHRWTARAMM